jgi:hypothetical protein
MKKVFENCKNLPLKVFIFSSEKGARTLLPPSFQNIKSPDTLSEESVCRLYEVGQLRDEEDDQVTLFTLLFLFMNTNLK